MQCETVQGGLHGNALIRQTFIKMWKQGKLGPFYRGLGEYQHFLSFLISTPPARICLSRPNPHTASILISHSKSGMGLAGMFPYSAIDLFIFEKSKSFYLDSRARTLRCHEDDVSMNNIVTASIGATSGAISATVVYPINLLRTRLQAQGTVLHQATYTGIVDVTRKTVRNEGIKGLFKGVTPNLLKVAPAVSISYVVYENAKEILGLH